MTPPKEKCPAALGGAGPGGNAGQENHNTAGSPVQRVLALLSDAKQNGTGWQARCPAHDDKKPSLSVSEGVGGRALVKCFAGCTVDAIVAALGVRMADLMPDRPHTNKSPGDNRKIFKTANDAVAALERKHGKRVELWTYCDTDGAPIGAVIRWDTASGKDIRPVSRNGTGWIIGAMSAPRPLYRLGELKDAGRVFVCEGEKKTDALVKLGFVVTTSAGGSGAAGKTDWSPLAGKECIILPDNDKPGTKYGDDVVSLLAKLSATPSVKIVELPGLSDGGDVFDFITARRTDGKNDDEIRAEIESLADATEKIEPGSSKSAPLPWQPFPVDALPKALRAFVMSLSKATATDPSMSALSVLVMCAGCIGNRVAAIVRGGWIEPAVLWGAPVVRSGGIKSPVFRNVKRPLIERYKAERIAFAEKMKEYEADMTRYAAERAKWMTARKNGDAGDPPLEPEQPIEHRVFVSDITVEKLACVLEKNPLGAIVLRDELAAFIGAFDRYAAGGKGSDCANYLSMYDAHDIVVDRKSQTGTIFVERAAVSILGTIQPAILQRLFGAEERESGALARFLLSAPPDKPALWTDSELSEDDSRAWGDILKGLLDIPPKPDDAGPRPNLLPIGRDAKPTFIAWHDAHERERVAVDDDDLSAHFSKLKGACVRIALILECVQAVSNGRSASFIGPDAMQRAIQITEWFKHEARRVYAMLGESDEGRGRRRLIELIERGGGQVTVREWQRRRHHPTADKAEVELNGLVKAGFGRWQPIPSGKQGGHPTTTFILCDTCDSDTTSANARESGVVSPVTLSHDDPDGLPPVTEDDAAEAMAMTGDDDLEVFEV